MKTHANSNHWSNYWQAGQLTSLPQDFKGNYNGEIKSEWNVCFNRLATKGTILDLCAGNCAIGLLAVEFSKSSGKQFDITSVDSANVTKDSILSKYPNEKNSLSQIKIIANCKVEDIKIESKQFDLITSQYGIEYCDWETVAKQVYRLLKQGGEFTMLTHSGSTEIIKLMNKESDHYKFLYHMELFKILESYGKNKLPYKIFIKDLKQIQQKLSQYFYNNPAPLLSSILLIVDNVIKMDNELLKENKFELVHLCNQHTHAYTRLKDLLRVTRSIVANPNWYKVFIQQGLQLIQKKSIFQNGKFNSGNLFQFKK